MKITIMKMYECEYVCVFFYLMDLFILKKYIYECNLSS